ncbi:hypothetical protein [Acetobacter papayae]|uniref:hypothetical protein n=1 Tax=Acetobacter papayae TaxID=1076592 RepID=UPI00131F1EA3
MDTISLVALLLSILPVHRRQWDKGRMLAVYRYRWCSACHPARYCLSAMVWWCAPLSCRA